MEQKKKKNIGFNIIKDDPTDGHRVFGAGAISLENVSPVIIDVEAGEAFVDMERCTHAALSSGALNFCPTVPPCRTASRTGSFG